MSQTDAKQPRTKLDVRMSAELRQAIERKARKINQHPSTLVRQLIEDYVKEAA